MSPKKTNQNPGHLIDKNVSNVHLATPALNTCHVLPRNFVYASGVNFFDNIRSPIIIINIGKRWATALSGVGHCFCRDHKCCKSLKEEKKEKKERELVIEPPIRLPLFRKPISSLVIFGFKSTRKKSTL